MAICDYAIDRYVRDRFFDRLNVLSPTERAAEKLRLEIEALDFELRETDELLGWFKFQDNGREFKQFKDEISDEKTQRIIDKPQEFGCNIKVDKAHTLVDYSFILNNGLASYERIILSELETEPDNEYLNAMKKSLDNVHLLLRRADKFLEEKYHQVGEAEKAKISEIRQIISKVPFKPAEDFREAAQSVWIIHFMLPLAENAWYSISLGRFDQYMYPFYKASLESGMSKAEAKSILKNFYELLNSYADGACLMNVGPTYNELSELLIECQKDFAMPAPILGARIDNNTPEHIWNALIDEKLFSMGQPTFYGEDACINALVEKGLPREKAIKFSNNSCMGISIAGEEFNSMWGIVFSVSAALEAAVNGGKLLLKDFTVPEIGAVNNIEELYESFEKTANYLLTVCEKSYRLKASISEKTDPDPFLSLLTKNCIEKHCDRISGAVYHNVTVECMGMTNVADGICAIDKLVFKDKKYTLNELCEAVKINFQGYEALRQDILDCPKYGQNSDADKYAVKVAEIMQRNIRNFNHDNYIFSPSLHTLDTNVGYGSSWGAGFDGRYAGTPFAKNAAPSNNVRKSDPTDLVLSAAKLPQYKFFGGQPIDINFGTDVINYHKAEIAALIKVYLANGGIQFQVNSLSSKLLRDATDNPEKYPNLIVRIGGYSLLFNSISQKSKEEFIERVAKEGY